MHHESNFGINSAHLYHYYSITAVEYHIVQSAPKERAFFGIEPFLDKPIFGHFLRVGHPCKRRNLKKKLVILAKEGTAINTLREAPASRYMYHSLSYKEIVENTTAQSYRDRRLKNEQIKNSWLSKCQRTEAARILSEDRPWKICHNEAVSLSYLNLAAEGRHFCLFKKAF